MPMPSAEISKPVRRVAALLGFLWKPEVDAHFKQEPFETIDGANHLDLWTEFDSKRAALPALATKTPAALPATASATIEEVKSRATYKEHYEALANFEFVSVDIETLLSPQWFADLDYIDEIAAKIPNAMSTEDMLRFSMSEGKITQPIVTGSTVHFTSPRRDLRSADHLEELGINPMSSRLYSFLSEATSGRRFFESIGGCFDPYAANVSDSAGASSVGVYICPSSLKEFGLKHRAVSHLWRLGILDTRTQRLSFDFAQGRPFGAQGKRAGLTSVAPTELAADRSENQGECKSKRLTE